LPAVVCVRNPGFQGGFAGAAKRTSGGGSTQARDETPGPAEAMTGHWCVFPALGESDIGRLKYHVRIHPNTKGDNGRRHRVSVDG